MTAPPPMPDGTIAVQAVDFMCSPRTCLPRVSLFFLALAGDFGRSEHIRDGHRFVVLA